MTKRLPTRPEAMPSQMATNMDCQLMASDFRAGEQ